MDRQERCRRDSIKGYIRANNSMEGLPKIYGYKFSKLGPRPALYLKRRHPFTGKLYFEWSGYLSNVFNESGTYKGIFGHWKEGYSL